MEGRIIYDFSDIIHIKNGKVLQDEFYDMGIRECKFYRKRENGVSKYIWNYYNGIRTLENIHNIGNGFSIREGYLYKNQ